MKSIAYRLAHSPNDSHERTLDFLLLMENYQGSYTQALEADASLAALPFADCSKQLYSKLIYYGDSYLKAFTDQGFRVQQLIPNCKPLQYKWAAEQGVWTPPAWMSRRPFRWYWTRGLKSHPQLWASEKILTEQLKALRPKYTWVFSGSLPPRKQIAQWREYTERLLLWWSCPLDPDFPYNEFDLIFSGIPTLVAYFKMLGINAALMAHAFDERVLQRVPVVEKRIPRVVFVGSLSRDHLERIVFLDALSRHVAVDFYGTGVELLPSDSPLRAGYKGSAWGESLYSVYGSYLIVFHKNIGVAGNFASAKRLFEATGMGACVVAEEMGEQTQLFKPGHEIVTYSSLEECIDKIKALLKEPEQAIAIGQSGQQRTLREHTYQQRVQQILEHLEQFDLL